MLNGAPFFVLHLAAHRHGKKGKNTFAVRAKDAAAQAWKVKRKKKKKK